MAATHPRIRAKAGRTKGKFYCGSWSAPITPQGTTIRPQRGRPGSAGTFVRPAFARHLHRAATSLCPPVSDSPHRLSLLRRSWVAQFHAGPPPGSGRGVSVCVVNDLSQASSSEGLAATDSFTPVPRDTEPTGRGGPAPTPTAFRSQPVLPRRPAAATSLPTPAPATGSCAGATHSSGGGIAHHQASGPGLRQL